MSTNFASLGISVESSQAAKASDDLDKLVDSAVEAEKAIDELGKTGEGLANTGKKISQAESEVAQGVEKTTGAIDRQATAGKKRSDSAAYEMTITRQLEAAVAAAAGSRENLSRANELYVKAQERGLLLTEDEIRLEGLLDKAELKVESSRMRQIAAAEKENAQKQKLIESENRRIEALKRTVNGIDPLTKKLAELEARERALNELHKSGEYDALRYNEALAKIGKDRAGLTEAASAFDKLRLGTRQAQENVMQLGNALSSGDWGSGIRAVTQLGAGAEISAARLLTMAGPIAIAAAAVGGLSYAYYKGHQEQESFNKSLILTGNIAGTSAGQLADMARQVSAVIGTTGQAAEVLASLAGSGKIASGSFVGISEAALAMEKATGKSVDATVAEFVKIAEDPVAAAKSLNEQYHFLTASVYSQIVALQEQGDMVGAAKILTDSYASTIETRAGQITKNLGLIERGWNDIRDAAKKALDIPLSLGREKTLAEQLDSERAKLADLDKKTSGNKIVAGSAAAKEERKQLEESIRLKEIYVEIEKRQSKYVGDRRKVEDDAVEATTRADARHLANLSNEGKRALEIKKINEDTAKIRAANPNDKRVDPKYVAEQIKDVNERYKDPKAAGSQVDLTSFNNAKNNLSDIVNDYRNAQKELEAQQKAGVVSLSDYAKQRTALINQEKDDVTAAYQAEIDALEAAKAKKGTTAAQSIQLDQKIADARQGMVKAQKDADSQLTVIATNEKGRLEQLTAASEAYVNQLERQRAALEAAGSRAANGLGLGDRQAGLQASLDATTDKFNDERAKLLDRRKTAPDKYSQEDYMRDLASLQDAEGKYRDTVVENYDKISEAQGDWRKGASSAFQNYLESAKDVAGQTKGLFTNAFSSMEDSIVDFALTGKLSFADFTKSIIADMARIAARQAASGLLSSIAGTALGAWLGGGGGGGTSFGADIGGAITANAKGGVYDSPSLSSFSNQVHDKPQMFAFAKGDAIFAEAGPEAIMPLTRTAGGELGVRALGGGGGGASGGNTESKMEVTININRDGSGDATADTAMGQKLAPQFLAMIRGEIAANERRTLSPSGGATWRAINGR